MNKPYEPYNYQPGRINTMHDVISAYGGKEPLSQDKKICANHPVGIWKIGYAKCYQGLKRNENCIELVEDPTISGR